MYSVLQRLNREQRHAATKQYNIPVRDAQGNVISYRCYDGGDFWYEVCKSKTGNYEKNSLTVGDVLQILGVPVTFDDQWNIQMTPEVERYYYEIWEIMDLVDSGKLKTWRQTRNLFNGTLTSQQGVS